MDDNMKEALNSFITKSVGMLEKGVDLAGEQIPLVVQEILMWHGIMSFIFWVISIVLLTVAVVLTRKIFADHKVAKENLSRWLEAGKGDRKKYSSVFFYIDFDGDVDGSASMVIPCAGIFFATVIGVIMFFHNFDWLQILVAPRLYLLEYASTLLSSK